MIQFPSTLNEIVSFVASSTGEEGFSYKPRYDLEFGGTTAALIMPDHQYAHWGDFQDKIVFWDPLRDGPYHVVASLRDGVTAKALCNVPFPPEIPVYDLERITIAADYPSSLDVEATVRGYAGSATDVAQHHYPGKFIYYTQLDSGLKLLVVGDAPLGNLHTPARVQLAARTSGRRDLIGRPIYVAQDLRFLEKAA